MTSINPRFNELSVELTFNADDKERNPEPQKWFHTKLKDDSTKML